MDDLVKRENDFKVYKEFLKRTSWMKRTSPWILVISGYGGAGKRELLRQWKDISIKNGIAVKCEFGDLSSTEIVKILNHIAHSVRTQCSEYQTYKAKSAEFFNLDPFQGDIKQTINADKDSTVQDIKMNASAKMDRSEKKALEAVREAFYEYIDGYLPQKLVLLLDNCELLEEPIDNANWIISHMLIELRERMRERGRLLYVVMASNVRLVKSREKLNKSIDSSSLIEHEIGALEEEAVKDYFRDKFGLNEAEREIVGKELYSITYGHAVCVHGIGEFWNESNLKKPMTEFSDKDWLDFRKNFYEYLIRRFIKQHIEKDDRSSNKKLRDLTRYGTILRQFDQNIFQNIFQDYFNVSDKELGDSFGRFIKFLYVLNRESNFYITELLRVIFFEHIRINDKKECEKYHSRAMQQIIANNRSENKADWYYHWLVVILLRKKQYQEIDWSNFFEDLRIKDLRIDEQKEAKDALRKAADDITLMFTDIPSAVQRYIEELSEKRSHVEKPELEQ